MNSGRPRNARFHIQALADTSRRTCLYGSCGWGIRWSFGTQLSVTTGPLKGKKTAVSIESRKGDCGGEDTPKQWKHCANDDAPVQTY